MRCDDSMIRYVSKICFELVNIEEHDLIIIIIIIEAKSEKK